MQTYPEQIYKEDAMRFVFTIQQQPCANLFLCVFPHQYADHNEILLIKKYLFYPQKFPKFILKSFATAHPPPVVTRLCQSMDGGNLNF